MIPFALDTTLLMLVWWLLTAAVHASFAVGVKYDAEQRQARGDEVLFVKPLMWGLAALSTGVLAVAVYWLLHSERARRVSSSVCMENLRAQSRFDAAIFDFDGTLADTLPLIALSWNHVMRPLFGREFSLAEIVQRFGPTDAVMIQRELEGRSPEEVAQVIEDYFGHYESAHDAARAFDGAGQLLADVRSAGFQVGLMTGKGRRAADITLRLLGWQDAFDYVVTGDETTHHKPHPEGVLAVARALGAEPSRCLYVGDLPVDIQAARSAGMTAVAAGWNAYDAAALRAENPDFWAEEPAQVLAFLRGNSQPAA